MASLLNKNRINTNNSISFKYSINCKNNQEDTEFSLENSLTSYPKEYDDTSDWLKIVSKIDTKSSDYKIFTGLLKKKKEIVAKIGSDKLEEEYIISKKLDSIDIPIFLKPYCFFHCLDDIKSLNENTRTICKKSGSNKINVIIMPYKLGELDKYKWTKDNFEVLKNILKHIVLSLCYAHKKLGFIHHDLHLGNILLQKTTRKEILYGEFGSLECMGLIPVIMDYDKSIINKDNYSLVYYDINRYINLCRSELSVKFNDNNISNKVYQYISKNSEITKKIIDNLLDNIDKFTYLFSDSDIPQMPNWSKTF